MVPAGVEAVLQDHHGGQVVSDSGVVLDVVEPPGYVGPLLLFLHGEVHLQGR